MITLNELLNQPIFSDLILLTNKDTLEREIKTIDITETPDVASFTSHHSLMLTTAMSFKHNQKELIPFIKSLMNVDGAGLCIKTSRFLHKIDLEVIEFANEHKFPIVEIPADKTLGVLSHNMLDYILGKQTQNMTYALDIQKHYSNLVIDGANTQQILDELNSTLKTPLILANPFIRVIGYTRDFNQTLNPVSVYINQLKTKIVNHNNKVKSFTLLDPKEQSTNVIVYPIDVNAMFPYYLIVFNPNTLTYPIANFAIDQSIMVLSFIIYKNIQVENSMIRLQNSFFTKLLFGNHPEDRKDAEFFEQGLNYGLISTNYYQVILCEVQENNENNSDIGMVIYQWLIEKTITGLKYGLVFYRDKTQVTSILLQHHVENLEEKLIQSAKELEALLDIKIHFGVGNPVDHPYEINNSYFEAVKALEKDSDEYIKHYNPTGIMTLFSQGNEEAINYFIREQLKELSFSTDSFHIELLTTLKTYLDHHGEITSTADALFLHRNTITYRIKKCEELLNSELRDPQVTLNLRIALELLKNH